MDKLDNLVKEVKQFTIDRDWDQFHSEENLAKSIAIEAGELLECYQWGNPKEKGHVLEELADVINYCIQLADKLNVDISEIVLDKIKKNALKYPVNKCKGKANKYTEL